MDIKRIVKKGIQYLFDRNYRFLFNASKGRYKNMTDKEYISKIYDAKLHKKMHWNNPVTFNEKLQWLKLYDHRPIYSILVDKYLVREYVAEKIGEQYLIPLLGVWDKAEEIDFQELPNQFVLKCNHNSGTGMVICTDKNKLDYDKVISTINVGLAQDYYQIVREWPYKNVKRKIIAEQYLIDSNVTRNSQLDSLGLIDYKFYCFNVEPHFLYIGYANIVDGKKNDYMSFRNIDWSVAEFGRDDHDPIPFQLEKPDNFEEMIDLARILAEGIPFVRVDLYSIDGNIFFSEFTLYPGSGYGIFRPEKYEQLFGTWINLDDVEKTNS